MACPIKDSNSLNIFGATLDLVMTFKMSLHSINLGCITSYIIKKVFYALRVQNIYKVLHNIFDLCISSCCLVNPSNEVETKYTLT